MDTAAIRAKFGDDYTADDLTFRMGMDQRFTARISERFRGRRVLETCTGAGFMTMALARVAAGVVTVEIDAGHQEQARRNVARAGLTDRVTFLLGDALDERTWRALPAVDAAFLDPDWAVTGPGHVHRFLHSAMRPPADVLLERVLLATPDVALVLPPGIDTREFEGLPAHELQHLYLEGSHEIDCLYFGGLARATGEAELRV